MTAGRDSSVGTVTRYELDGTRIESRLLGLRVRIPLEAWIFVLCVVREDKQAKCRTIKTKKQVRMKYKQNTGEYKKKFPWS